MSKKFARMSGFVLLLLFAIGVLPIWKSPPDAAQPLLRVEAGYGRLFGAFPVNILLSLLYLGAGIWGLSASRRTYRARRFGRGMAWIFGALALFGIVPPQQRLFGLAPVYGADVVLHAAAGAVGAYFGFVRPRRQRLARHDGQPEAECYATGGFRAATGSQEAIALLASSHPPAKPMGRTVTAKTRKE
ncbi:MAG: DUF4383 domain-containing protein [Candidatus Eisenbacteria bacterium]|nr:DUF4383 domain-containing protein [Candidatus Eisenbacteria bacterium]